jgi:signal transduction histidine kinase
MDMHEQLITSEPCEPAAILRELCLANSAGARILLTPQPEALVRSDPVVLRVIFGNLIENALKYSRPESHVNVIMRPKAMGQLVIWFENEEGAAGLPDPARVFEKYYRSSRAMSQIGSGLGLYLVQGLVRNLGGGITYEPEEGRARFRLWLPC